MTNVKVGIKFRPFLEHEFEKKLQWEVGTKQIKSMNGKHNLEFGKLKSDKVTK